MALVGLVGTGVARGEEPPVIVVEPGGDTCPEHLLVELVEEFHLRTSAQLVAATAVPSSEQGHTLTLSPVDEASCEVRLETRDDTHSLVVDRNAEPLEIASTANRLAWIIGGAELQPPPSPQERANGANEYKATVAMTEQTAGITSRRVANAAGKYTAGVAGRRVAGVATNISAAAPPPKTGRPFSVDAVGGAMWLPAAQAILPLARLRASWQPWSAVRFAVNSRIPMGRVEATDGDVRHQYRPWSFDLTAGYVQHVGETWSIGVDGGIRLTVPTLSATELDRGGPEGTPGESFSGTSEEMIEATPGRVTSESESAVGDALSPWLIVANVAMSYPVMEMLVVRFDTGIAFSPADRKIRDDHRVVIDLGHFEFDAVLGLELRI